MSLAKLCYINNSLFDYNSTTLITRVDPTISFNSHVGVTISVSHEQVLLTFLSIWVYSIISTLATGFQYIIHNNHMLTLHAHP